MSEEKEWYSQYGQDKWVVDTHLNYKENGYFVDIGAGNGIFLSNTYYLEKNLGWEGICVEANDSTFGELTSNRKYCDNNCILDDGSEVTFNNVTNSTGWENLLSGINGLVHYETNNESTISKTTISLNTLLDKYDAPQVIDYISMDIEGAELQALQEFFKTNKREIKLWTIENTNTKEVVALMQANGYEVVHSLGADNVYKLK